MAEPLKNRLNHTYVCQLASEIKKNYPPFLTENFVNHTIDKNWDHLELKQRMGQICDQLGQHLPDDFVKSIPVILQTAPHFSGFEALFFPDFVVRFGFEKKYRKLALQALEQLTQYSSSEFAVRPFIQAEPTSTMKWMLKLSKHKNYHMRRLASEGCRPRLPWASALPDFKKNPTLIFPILENLKNDPHLYVRKSVANNINDICKDNPTVILPILKKWKKESPQDNTLWIINHGLRSLIKSGDPEALDIVGFKKNARIQSSRPKVVDKFVQFGNPLSFSIELKNESTKAQPVLVDYLIHHLKKTGEHRPKVFKLTKLTLRAGEKVLIKKAHKFEKISTRVYYPGDHYLQLQINGVLQPKVKFTLEM